jgi:hypothetical protein
MCELPALVRLPDRTLVQHCGSDAYALLIDAASPDPIVAVNVKVRDFLLHQGESTLWELLSGPNVFATQPERLQRWLDTTGSRRVVFGHKPHGGRVPAIFHSGKAINFDGGFSRSHRKFRRLTPIGATVAPLGD